MGGSQWNRLFYVSSAFSHAYIITPLTSHLYIYLFFFSTGAARLAAVGGLVFAYEAARRERRPGAAPVCSPSATLLLRLPEWEHPQPSRSHLSPLTPTESGSSPNRAPSCGTPSPPRPIQR